MLCDVSAKTAAKHEVPESSLPRRQIHALRSSASRHSTLCDSLFRSVGLCLGEPSEAVGPRRVGLECARIWAEAIQLPTTWSCALPFARSEELLFVTSTYGFAIHSTERVVLGAGSVACAEVCQECASYLHLCSSRRASGEAGTRPQPVRTVP